MDLDDDPDGGCTEDKEGSSGSVSLSGSFGSSLSSSNDFRRQMKPPNKKKHDDEMEELIKQIRTKETELRSLGATSQESTASELQSFRDQRDVASGKRKKLENDLRSINQEITRKMGLLSRTESNLHYKNEAKIDDAIRNMEWQLKSQNFSLKEERKIVAEIDKLKRSKKTLLEYFTQKKDVDKLREGQRRIRSEKDNLYKIITNLKSSEEELKKSSQSKRAKSEILRKELNELHEKKRQMIADFKQHESDFHRMMKEKRNNHRKESFRKKEEDRKAKEQAWKKERMEYELQREPFEDEKYLCNTLISYLQRFMNTEQKDDPTPLPSPRDEQPETQLGACPADSLDDGMLILLKKSENENLDYSVTSKRTQKRSRKGRKLSVTKPLAHTPQIIAQFLSLTLNAPSNMSEVAASIEQLLARKRYYEEQTSREPHPLLGSLNSSFSSSGSMSSLDSPLRERNATWSFVDVPPAIAENQTPSDAGVSAESGFHDMSRQVSKTESSESATDAGIDPVLDELIRQSSEQDCGDGEHSRSSSDTITPEDHVTDVTEETDPTTAEGVEDNAQSVGVETIQGNIECLSDYQSNPSSDSNDSNNVSVFDKSEDIALPPEKETVSTTSKKSRKLRGRNSSSKTIRKPVVIDLISNYDDDFPPTLGSPGQTSDSKATSKTSLNAIDCDETQTSDTSSLQTPFNVLVSDSSKGGENGKPVDVLVSDLESPVVPNSPISIVVDSYEDTVATGNVGLGNVPEKLDDSGADNSVTDLYQGVSCADLNEQVELTEAPSSLTPSGDASLEVAGSSSSDEFISLEDSVTHF